MKLMLLFLAVSFASFHRITETENEERKRHCGLSYLSLRGEYKTIGGRRVKPDEYPWLARIIYTEKVPPRSVRFKKCSGVQISQRHVMTAMHCVVHYDERGNLRKMDPSGFSIYFGSYCGQHREFRNPHTAANTTGKKWKGNALDVAGDLAIIELRDDVSPGVALPICMPQKDTVLADSLKYAGSGMDRVASGLGSLGALKSSMIDGVSPFNS
ncbi:hypothetical protein Aduo_005947 [Ancylostoma duodenale]